ncbi:uncharacterized protein LOC144106628 isoform X2 [Amblyomma americanum]
MKEPRKGHSRRCRSVECRAENTGDDHLFRNPLSKWYRGRRRSKDDEAQLLGAEYDAGHESGSSQQQARSGSQQPVTKSSSAVPPAITRPPKRPCPPGPPPTHRPPPAPTAAFGGPQVRVSLPEEDLSTRTKQAAGHQTGNADKCEVSSAVPALPPRPASCQPLQLPGKSRSLCPAERARLAFPGCQGQEATPSQSPSRTQARSPSRATGVLSLDALLGQLCSSHCNIAMKIKEKDRDGEHHHRHEECRSLAQKSSGEICAMKEVAPTPCSRHFPTSFPTSIEVLMTVKHSCSTHPSLSERSLQRDSSMVSVVHSKPGHQEIISIPKSRFLVVAALLSFVMVACFCIAIYSFSVPADHWRGNASTKPPNLAQSVPPAPTPTSAVLINTTAANVSAVMSAAPKLAQDQPLALLQPQRTDNRSLRSRPRFVIL